MAAKVCLQGDHAGLKMSYFRFYIYKAIRKVLFLPILTERSIKVLFLLLKKLQ